MERLNSQLEQALADLLSIEKGGGNATSRIFDVLSGTSGSEREYRYMRELVALGFIDGSAGDASGGCDVEGLTSRAYSYFDDLEAEEKRQKRERRFDRIWSVAIALISGSCGVAVTLIVQHLSGTG